MASMDEVKKLMAKKNEIDAEIKELMEVLELQGGVGMTGSLVDKEDYPRSDIDVHSVRHARHRIICLQNDHKSLMKEIEDGLHNIHAVARQQKETSGEAMDVQNTSPEFNGSQAFVRVDRVDADSPAAAAKLQIGDLIVQFGSITINNFQGLQSVGSIVQHSEGKSLPVTVIREEQQQRLYLTPQKWSGRGLLGCNIVPIK